MMEEGKNKKDIKKRKGGEIKGLTGHGGAPLVPVLGEDKKQTIWLKK